MESESVLAAAIHTPDRDAGPLQGTVAGSWSLGIVEQSQGEGCCCLWRDRSRGYEGGDCGGKCLWRKAKQPCKQGDTAESCIAGGAITIAFLSSQASQHQQLNSREVGPSSTWGTELQSRAPARAAPLCAWRPEQREGPQAKEPSKCLNGRSYGERLAKEAFWSPATRGSKKRLTRP